MTKLTAKKDLLRHLVTFAVLVVFVAMAIGSAAAP